MRRLFVIALALTIVLPLVAVLLAFAAVSSQAQCAGGAAGPGSAPGVPSSLLRSSSRPPAATSSDPEDGRIWPRSTRSRATSITPRCRACTPAPTLTAPPGRCRSGSPAPRATVGRDQVDAPGGPLPPSVYDETDAVYAAANYLHASGAPGDWPAALYAYNHAGWYVAQVQQLAQRYAQTAGNAITAGAPAQPGCVAAGPTTPGSAARILPDGLAAAPQDAPAQVQAAVAAGNRIIDTSYSTERQPNMLSTVMGSYDCSGSTDFVLYNAGLNSPQVDVGDGIAGDSGMLESYGNPGPGRWITVFASAGHAFIQVAGIVLDTAHWTPTTPSGSGPRWQPASTLPSQLADGNTWTERHPPGL